MEDIKQEFVKTDCAFKTLYEATKVKFVELENKFDAMSSKASEKYAMLREEFEMTFGQLEGQFNIVSQQSEALYKQLQQNIVGYQNLYVKTENTFRRLDQEQSSGGDGCRGVAEEGRRRPKNCISVKCLIPKRLGDKIKRIQNLAG